ncbi:hypothetical protein [Haloarcula sediminis]|uniref:hypothetical protein n=1 Tax=Haloarcula sediminis TaxID=3111777 RepID=UPI002D799BE7|nr:hypothetical protein [Haloarcula sp. CK38]
MSQSGQRNNLTVLLVGLFLLFAPALFVVATLEFLILSGDLVLSEITPVEFLELYLIDLVLFAGVGYGVYRLTLWVVANRLPAASDVREADSAPDDAADPEASGDDSQ